MDLSKRGGEKGSGICEEISKWGFEMVRGGSPLRARAIFEESFVGRFEVYDDELN
ncbi:hypothetical protein IMZ48_33820 [Candidatus Bathyarchaeota archaeon]|nr:hypothetical protein [Candidatus Bathyarchaeota archaeon]